MNRRLSSTWVSIKTHRPRLHVSQLILMLLDLLCLVFVLRGQGLKLGGGVERFFLEVRFVGLELGQLVQHRPDASPRIVQLLPDAFCVGFHRIQLAGE